MSNLAQLSVQLNQKDSERSAVIDEIRKLNDLKFQDFVGKMQFSVYQVDGLEGRTLEFDYEVTPIEDFISTESLRNRSLADHISLLVRTQDLKITLKCKAFSTTKFIDNADVDGEDSEEVAEVLEKSEAIYVVTLNAMDIPVDTELRTELISTFVAPTEEGAEFNEEDANAHPVFHMKASYDKIHALLESKALELEQLENDVVEISKSMKDTKKASSSKKEGQRVIKGGKKGGRGAGKRQSAARAAAAAREEEEDDEDEASKPAAGVMGSIAHSVGMAGAMALGFGVEYRAYLMFGAASAVIFLYGDMASV